MSQYNRTYTSSPKIINIASEVFAQETIIKVAKRHTAKNDKCIATFGFKYNVKRIQT